jgi:membrane fusion protein (multidrug efflux system)
MNACSFIFISISFLAGPTQAQQQTVPLVGTVYAQRKPISQTADFVGRVEAVDKVDIHARVTGFLEAVLFKEGDFVKKGSPLYRIEQDQYQAAVVQAQGALDRSKADKDLAQVQLNRATTLLAERSIAAEAVDQDRTAYLRAQGQMLTDQANLDFARINLGYTDIMAPISGKISKTNITVGNVVGPNSGVLTTIVSQDPMYVTFPVSHRNVLQFQQRREMQEIKDIKVRLRFANGTTYGQTGSINFLDVTVDRSTDTVLVRASMPNPTGLLIDGELVTVTLEAGTPEERVLVPQAALIADQEGIYVFAVEHGKAVVKRIKTSGESGLDDIVSQGLKGGEQIIVQGLQSVRPGQPVQASPVQSSLNPG